MAYRRESPHALIGPAIVCAICVALLASLGFWQLHRLAWKETILARIEQRVHQAPAPLPAREAWAALSADEVDYTHVKAKGRFIEGKEALVFRASAPRQGDRSAGPGYDVIAPFALDGGGTVLVNRGFAPLAWKDQAALRTEPPAGDVEIAGLTRAAEERNMFTPVDQPDKAVWFTRDPRAIAQKLGLADAAPFAIDLDAGPNEKGWPHGGATVLNIPNNHLSYALTWFGLAATLVVVFVVWAWGRGRGRAIPAMD
jgi:surfeit locus 1 family protein